MSAYLTLIFRFVMSTESYGARLAPTFVNYFNSQNALIESGELQALRLVVTALSISKYAILFRFSSSSSLTNLISGKHDPINQLKTTASFAHDAPGYGRLASKTVVGDVKDAFHDVCLPKLEECAEQTSNGSDKANATCADANNICVRSFSCSLH
jgi:hypothetical protein